MLHQLEDYNFLDRELRLYKSHSINKLSFALCVCYVVFQNTIWAHYGCSIVTYPLLIRWGACRARQGLAAIGSLDDRITL